MRKSHKATKVQSSCKKTSCFKCATIEAKNWWKDVESKPDMRQMTVVFAVVAVVIAVVAVIVFVLVVVVVDVDVVGGGDGGGGGVVVYSR